MEDHWKSIKTFEDAYSYVRSHLGYELTESYTLTLIDSYEEIIAKYRIVVAALTNNEKRHFTTKEAWIPYVKFCSIGEKYEEDNIIGTIESEGSQYTVVGNYAHCLSNDSIPRLLTVSSKEIALHISKYFGRLLFEVYYGKQKWV